MALKAGYKGIKHVGPGLNLNRNGDLTIKGAVPTTLEQLSDVEIDTALGGDVLRFDSTGNVWEAEQPSTTPEEDSDDLITSGGVYAALQQIRPVNADWNATEGLAEILNKPTIPAAQVNSDWNATEGLAEILNKPTIPAAQVNSDWNASSGIAEILNKPTIPDISGKSDITAIGTNETNSTASKAYAAGEHFYKNGRFCTAITAIASGETFTLNTNYVEGTIAQSTFFELVENVTLSGCASDSFIKLYKCNNLVVAAYHITLSNALAVDTALQIGTISNDILTPIVSHAACISASTAGHTDPQGILAFGSDKKISIMNNYKATQASKFYTNGFTCYLTAY